MVSHHNRSISRRNPMAVFLALAAGLSLSACAGHSPLASAIGGGSGEPAQVVSSTDVSPEQLDQATRHWAMEYARDPKNEQAAIAYAANLKAQGEKARAYSVLQQAEMYNPDSRRITSEYGRLAVSMGDVDLARKLLARADDPSNPDWKVLSALGTIEAKSGNLADARSYFQRAHELAPDESSVKNNLALAYAMDGKAEEAESLLRTTVDGDGTNSRVRQNLALVLGLQGKFDEAKDVAAVDLDAPEAQKNIAFLRGWVKSEPQAKAPDAPTAVAWAADVSTDAWATSTEPVVLRPSRPAAVTAPVGPVAVLRSSSQPASALPSMSGQLAQASMR